MAPLVTESRKFSNLFEVEVCVTAQHRKMLDQALSFFDINPKYDLNLMKPNQTLFDTISNGLRGLNEVLESYQPDLLFVQGDTNTAFMGALSGYFKKVKVAHLEAGLRSGHKYSPFPEEMNRILISHIADYHFAPTKRAKDNLNKEGISNKVWVVGNTVIDALFFGLNLIRKQGEIEYFEYFDFLDFSKKIILVTGHRRENFGIPFENICNALIELVTMFSNIEIIYPVHLNPNVREPVYRILKDHKRIHLLEPLKYPYLIWLMDKSYIIITDSGGIQEEAPSLGKPVLVLREVTERIEGIEKGTAKLVTTEKKKIVEETSILLNNETEYVKMANAINPYGDGKTANKIFNILSEEL